MVVPSHHVLLLLVLSWCVEGFWLQLQGVLRLSWVLWACQCCSAQPVPLTEGLGCLCLLQQNVCDWKRRWNWSFKSGEQFSRELVKFFFKNFILIEMKENFSPWGYYWEVLLSFTQFSAISFAAFKMMNPRPACGFTDQHNAMWTVWCQKKRQSAAI